MKLKTLLFITIFSTTPLLSTAEDNLTALIDEAKKAPLFKRIELIIQIKKLIASMNEEKRAVAIAEVQVQREVFRNENNVSQEQVEEFRAKMIAYEVNQSNDINKSEVSYFRR
jgi:glycerol-3-phosphate cytidylyltransferase-like family protein